jgi:hypothetical protein
MKLLRSTMRLLSSSIPSHGVAIPGLKHPRHVHVRSTAMPSSPDWTGVLVTAQGAILSTFVPHKPISSAGRVFIADRTQLNRNHGLFGRHKQAWWLETGQELTTVITPSAAGPTRYLRVAKLPKETVGFLGVLGPRDCGDERLALTAGT